MDYKLSELESECDKLRHRLSSHEELQSEVLLLKEELETSLESHKKLQEVALAFEEENRCIQSRYTEQLKDKSKVCRSFIINLTNFVPGDSSPTSCPSGKFGSAPALGLPRSLLFLWPWGRPGAGGAGVAAAYEGGG